MNISSCFAKNKSSTVPHNLITSPPEGGCEVLFSPGLCVCLSVCVSVCPANILVFYFSAIRRDIDLKFIREDTYIVVLNLLPFTGCLFSSSDAKVIGPRLRYLDIVKVALSFITWKL